ncbi:MAG TPA: hypothetical protein VGK33_13735 [Chloroflexota bacterium]
MAGLELVDWPADRSLVVSGSPPTLRIPLTIRNPSGAPAMLAEPTLAEMRRTEDGLRLSAAASPLFLNVPANGVAGGRMRLRLDATTAPGRYEGEVRMGDITRTIVIEVLPETKLDVRPSPVVVDASQGRDQPVTARFENRGNVPLHIDAAGTYPLFREIAGGAEHVGPEAVSPLGGLLEQLIGRTPNLAPDGEAELASPNGPLSLAPGESSFATLALKLPEGMSPTDRYHVFAPLYASDLHIVIVTAAKPRRVRKPGGAAKETRA